MQRLARILTGVAGLAIVTGSAAPALAQSNYGQYGGQYGGQYQQYPYTGGGVGAVIGQILGGGRYGAYGQGTDRVAVDQCARAAEAQSSRYPQGGGYYDQNRGYSNGYGNNGYGYGNQYGAGGARVVGITKVERKSNGLRIYGLMSSGMGYQGQYGQTPYGYGSQGYGQGYPSQGYGDPRYGQSYPGYQGQGYGTSQTADLSFNCRVDYRGYVSDVRIKRNLPRASY